MVYAVTGRTIYPGYTVNVFVDDGQPLPSCPDNFRAIVFHSGSAFAELDGESLFIESPAILCLNGSETLEIQKSDSLACRQVFFQPSVINVHLTREVIFEPAAHGTGQTYCQDLYWLDPFSGHSNRYIALGPGSLAQCMSLLDALGKSLDEQVDPYWPCRSRSYFLEFLFYARNVASKYIDCRVGVNGGPEKFEDILLYLHTNYQDDLALPDLCERFAINRTSLNELFRENTGQSVIQYLIALRIRLACLLLRDTTIPVKEVVSRTGFNDLVNFNRMFKKITLRTPSAYRQEFCFMITG